MRATLADIVTHLCGSGYVFRGDSYEGISSPEGKAVPSLEKIETARPTVEAALAAAAAAAAVPAEVSMAQFRLALLAAGIDPNTIAHSLVGDPAALIRWEYTTTVRRAHPLVTAMAAQLEKSSAEVDAIFIAAATL